MFFQRYTRDISLKSSDPSVLNLLVFNNNTECKFPRESVFKIGKSNTEVVKVLPKCGE